MQSGAFDSINSGCFKEKSITFNAFYYHRIGPIPQVSVIGTDLYNPL